MKNLQADQVLSKLQDCITIFLDQLSAERELLLTGDATDLNNITLQKQETIKELTELETQFSPVLDKFADEPTLNKKWQHTIELLKTCQQKNIENSSLVNHRLKQTNNTLHQLHSLFDTNHSAVYAEDGSQKISSATNRSVHA